MKIFISPCPNDIFMFEAIINKRIDLENMEFEVEYYDIEELNSRAKNKEAQITKVSCAMLPMLDRKYSTSNVGAALGHGNGPLLVRKKGSTNSTSKERRIDKIAIPGLNTTANLLISKFFPEIKQSNRVPMLFSDISAAVADDSNDIDAGVLIHESRFLYANDGLELVADLGKLWEERTNLPLPLGAIALRRDLTTREQQNFQRILRKSIEFAMASPAVSRPLIKEHAQELDDKVIDQHIKLFVNKYSLELGIEGKTALKQLLG